MAESRRHEQEMRARCGALDENWVAADLARLRYEQYPCENARSLLLGRYDRPTDREQIHVVYPRCKNWRCPACSHLHREENKANIRLRFIGEGSAPTAWTAEIDFAQRIAITQRIRNRRGRYGWVRLNDGRLRLAANVAFTEGQETTGQDASERLCQAVDAFDGDSKGRNKVVEMSKGWGIPRLPPGDAGFRFLATVDGDVKIADMIALAGEDAWDLFVCDVDVPKKQKYKARRWVVAGLPKRWDQERRRTYVQEIVVSVLPPFWRRRLSKAKENPYTVRSGQTLAYADLPE